MRKKIFLFTFTTTLASLLYIYYFSKIDTKNSSNFHFIEKLKDETYYFPAKKFTYSKRVYQPLKQFDLIFAGHDINSKKLSLVHHMSAIIPGKYTHVFAYIGKDKSGYAYAVEINADKNQTFSLNYKGLNIGGELHLFCLGADFNDTCPNDTYSYGIKTYDYMWAKRLNPKLKKQLLRYKNELISVIKQDLANKYPFKLPFDFNVKTSLDKSLPFIIDTHENGSDCVSYFVSLFEKVAKIHFSDIWMSSKELNAYYLYDPIGQEAILPKKYNPITNEDTYVKNLIRDLGYTFIDETHKGIATPDLLFNSSSLVEIKN